MNPRKGIATLWRADAFLRGGRSMLKCDESSQGDCYCREAVTTQSHHDLLKCDESSQGDCYACSHGSPATTPFRGC